MKQLTRFITSERTVSAVILLNTLALLFQDHTGDSVPLSEPWFWVDYGCVAFYLVEALFKTFSRGWRAYWLDGWNRFDFLVLILSFPVLVTPWLDLHQFAVLTVLRMGRLFRLFRLLHFIPNRHHLISGIGRALRASIGVFLALALINIVLAVGASMLFGKLAPEHFGNPFMACYSIFRVFTVEGWYEIPELLSQRAQTPLLGLVARLYFVLSVGIGGLLGLSLANAVFVDEMTIDNTARLEEKVDRLTEKLAEITELLEKGISGT